MACGGADSFQTPAIPWGGWVFSPFSKPPFGLFFPYLRDTPRTKPYCDNNERPWKESDRRSLATVVGGKGLSEGRSDR